MSTWQSPDLEQINTNKEIHLAVDKRDGSAGKPVIMWAVELNGEVYVRAVHGDESPWYRRALEVQQATMEMGSLHTRVTLAHDTTTDADALDAVYRRKYASNAQSSIDATVTDIARTSTLKLSPAR